MVAPMPALSLAAPVPAAVNSVKAPKRTSVGAV